MPSKSFHSQLRKAAASTGGPMLLSQVDAEALSDVAVSAAEGAELFFVHTSYQVLCEAVQALARLELRRPVLYFHGSTSEFFREIPAHPAVAAVPGDLDAFAMWQDLPAGGILLTGEALSEEKHWTEAEFLELGGGDEHCGVYRTTGQFRAHVRELPSPLYRTLCGALFAALFESEGVNRRGSYSPMNRLTAAAREWWREAEAERSSGYSGWPYSGTPTPLPDTLPNGERWPVISVITPAYNQGRYIEETILSVANQGYPRVEHIVIDGGSTDETAAVMQRHKHHLAAAVSERDSGQGHAINKGMALATGEILTWLNSDDMLAPGALAAMAMGFHMSRADLIAGVVTLRADGKTVGHHMTSCAPGPLPLDELLDLDGGWNAGRFFYQPEVMFTREIWKRAGARVREDLFFSMDYDLWVRMAAARGRLHVIGRPVAWFRLHEQQKTHVEAAFKAELRQYVAEYRERTKTTPRPGKAGGAERQSLRITMLNDHGYNFGAGIAHERIARTLAMAGHTVSALSLWGDPGFTDELTALTAKEVADAVDKTLPDLVVAGNIHSVGPDPWQLGLVAERHSTLSVLHDFWLLTGRCAYPKPCEKYLTGCDALCPTADENPRLDPPLISGAWERKQNLLFSDNQLILLANSQWSCNFARETMAKTGHGRTGRPVAQFRLSFPLDLFQPRDRQTCRAIYALPADRFIVLLNGDLLDRRKNMQLALDALASLKLPNLTVVSLGEQWPEERFDFDDMRRLGQINDPEQMASLYAAADVYVAPSLEETFGQVYIESIACGTPVVGMRSSGMQEAIVEGMTGLLVDEYSAEALAAAIFELYRKPELRRRMGQWGRLWVENEWSMQAAYFHMFQAWRELGLLDKLRVSPKIRFLADAPGAPMCQPIRWGEELTLEASTLGPEEGPFVEFGLPRFRWACGPVSRLDFESMNGGGHSLVLRYRNLQEGQVVRLVLNGQSLGTFPLPVTGIENGRLICVRADLEAGANMLRMEFSRWADAAREGRPLALAVTDVRFLREVRG